MTVFLNEFYFISTSWSVIVVESTPPDNDTHILLYIIMTNLHKRFLLFLLLCIPTRFMMAYAAKQASSKTLNLMGWIALLPACGFMYIYLTNSRKTGGETFGEQIWWNSLRPIHSLFYFAFAFLALKDVKFAYKALVLDLILGFVSFTTKHLIT